ncbi:MAG: hypothetical protein ACE5FM_02160 [Methyloligellaceae bacterium]
MTRQMSSIEARNRAVKVIFGVMALMCLLTGLVIYLFAEQFGFSHETARIVAIAFLAAGVADYIVLKLWDRITARR